MSCEVMTIMLPLTSLYFTPSEIIWRDILKILRDFGGRVMQSSESPKIWILLCMIIWILVTMFN